jgi:YbbR domain-containing protein
VSFDLDKLTTKLLHNKGLKLVSLVLAAVTWYYIQDVTSYEGVIRDITVDIVAPEGWKPRKSYDVAVALRGSQSDILNLDKSQISVVADISKRSADYIMQVELNPSSVQTPRAVRVVDIMPSEIQVSLDRGGETEVTVEVNKVGEPAQGFSLDGVTVNPDVVKISGARYLLDRITNVFTRSVDLDGRTRSFSRTVALELPREVSEDPIEINPAEVTLNFTITEITMDRLIDQVPVRLMLPPGRTSQFVLDPATVNITLQGRVNIISNLAEQAVNAFVNINSTALTGETLELPVEVTTGASGVKVLQVEPATVRLVESGESP